MGVLLEICCIFSEHLFKRTPLEGWFPTMNSQSPDTVLNRIITKNEVFCLQVWKDRRIFLFIFRGYSFQIKREMITSTDGDVVYTSYRRWNDV